MSAPGILAPTGGLLGMIGPTGPVEITEEEWCNPTAFSGHDEKGSVCEYKVHGYRHHYTKPAVSNPYRKEWWMKGSKLSDEDVKVIEKIMSDITVAPLYINHELFKHLARNALSLLD